MTEIIDNAVQLSVTLVCAVFSLCLFIKSRKQAYLILTCYYAAFSMGNIYWLVYDLITSYTPKIFYVSDLCWVAGYIFLLMLVTETAGEDERTYRHPAAWIFPVISAGMALFYCQWGDYAENVIWCGIMGAAGWFAANGFIWSVRNKKNERRDFLISVMSLIIIEYILWTTSCFWVSDSMSNPYFWFDYMLSASAAVLFITNAKAVGV